MIQLAKPNITEEAIQKVSDVLRSGNLVQGKYVAAFEKKLEDYLNVKNVVVVSSGTAALHLSLIAIGIKEGDEVIVPAFTFPATANVVELVGAKPVFVDINLSDFCINTSKIEDAITPKTVAIMPVHEFGQAAKMDDILQITRKYNFKLVEDAACALGTEFNGQKVGTFGDLGCFSFHPRKAITTGEGGAIATNNNNLAQKLKALRNHGIELINNKVEFNYAAYNYRMTDFQAVMGLCQLDGFEDKISLRIGTAEKYNEYFKVIDWIKTPEFFSNRKNIFQTYHIIVDKELNRNELIGFLKRNGVQTNYGAQALHLQNYFLNKYIFKKGQFRNAEIGFKNGLALPMVDSLQQNDFIKITKLLKEFLYIK